MIQDLEVAARIAPLCAAAGFESGRSQRRALLGFAEGLSPRSWELPTECRPWTVRELVAHVVAATRLARRPWQFPIDTARARLRHPGVPELDAYNELRIEQLRALSAAELLVRFQRAIPLARPPRLVRGIPVKADGMPPDATIGYFVDVILVRDVYMHRLDLARALDLEPLPDDSDAVVVAQVIRDLGRGWTGPPIELRLTGPTGGAWLLGVAAAGMAAEIVEVTAEDLMRHLSGRESGVDAVALKDARILF